MNTRVAKMMRGTHYKRIENMLDEGTPDCNWTNGWAELKTIEEWPKGADTIFHISNFSDGQRRWLKRRCKAGGRAFLILHCEGDWLLFWGEHCNCIGLCTKDELFDVVAVATSRGRLNEEKLQLF